ncbi:MAG: hypothetical protein GAK28_03061 [Luteibacter sp.]|uniref:hypothetical protein n=1 Tax=Luteibacter sp. TaxID=1886636 RepID=UPI00137CD3E3|nr:hypothetical protein [Luteibacter sp.]KAF1005840.1 MAG: hypothetical protein GAK28_03061 [Luteibacter sp.]
MNAMSRLATLGLALGLALSAGASVAQDATPVPGHPRVNEVNQRLDNQQNRIANGEANGTMNGKQAARDEKQDANIAQRESRDEAKNGGHLTKKEDHNLNRSLNHDSKRIHNQKTK